MSQKIQSATIIGLQAELIEVEASSSMGMTNFFLVGLPDTEIKEARERVRAAIKASGLPFPRGRIIVNLAPARVKKTGTHFDIPIALSLLSSLGELELKKTKDALFMGELGLDGTVRPITGVLIAALAARDHNINTIYVPEANVNEASIVKECRVYPIKTLAGLVRHLNGEEEIKPAEPQRFSIQESTKHKFDMADVRGQEYVKRALEIAAAGGHNVLLNGPPGSGKTLLAKTFASILPELNLPEALEVSKIYSAAGLVEEGKPLVATRPFRHPHHSASSVSIVGGGGWPRPGEISLAHRGVLFMDEFPEFPRHVLETLRQPLEDGIITVARAAGTFTFPAKFMLLAAMNPCPCGFASDPDKQCVCTPRRLVDYSKKISGPLLDRIDLGVEVPKVKTEALMRDEPAEASDVIRKRVKAARMIQHERLNQHNIFVNSEMSSRLIKQFCPLNDAGSKLLEQAIKTKHLSARAYTRVLKISRTIADLAGEGMIAPEHILEALQYRPKTAEL